MTRHEKLLNAAKRHLVQNYRQQPVVLTRGEGCELWDVRGHRYLDMTAGIAVCCLGHAHPKLVQALKDQVVRFWQSMGIVVLEAGATVPADQILDTPYHPTLEGARQRTELLVSELCERLPICLHGKATTSRSATATSTSRPSAPAGCRPTTSPRARARSTRGSAAPTGRRRGLARMSEELRSPAP